MSGNASFYELENKIMQISASDKTIINWQDFSIKAGEITKFLQPSNTASVLNRVVGENISSIFGNLEANGHIYLINPNGMIFGKDAHIDTASFTASTLDVLDEDFLKNNQMVFTGNAKGKIVNQGMVKAKSGNITLLAYQIENLGKIQAKNGEASLVCGQEIILQLEEDNLLIRATKGTDQEDEIGIFNQGTIEAIKTQLETGSNPYAYAIKQEGKVHSFGIENKDGEVLIIAKEGSSYIRGEVISKNENGGKIQILGDKVGLFESTKIDASGENGGGEILIGGDFQGKNPNVPNSQMLFVGEDVEIYADAKSTGNGGKIICWSDENTQFYGFATARGGETSGDGGLIEVSGAHLHFLPKKAPLTLSPNGKAGELLLDPTSMTISAVADANVPVGTPFQPVLAGVATNLSTATLLGALGGGNVTVRTFNDAPAGNGDITLLAPTAIGVWGGTVLTIDTASSTTGDIIIQPGSSINGDGVLRLYTYDGDIQIDGVIASSAGVILDIQNNGTVKVTNDLHATGGSGLAFNLPGGTPGSGLEITAGATPAICYSQSSNTYLYMPNKNITIQGGAGAGASLYTVGIANIDIDACQDLKLQPGAAIGADATIIVANGTLDITSNSTITLDATGGGLNASSYIEDQIGNMTISANQLDLKGGNSAAGNNRAYIFTNTGDITFTTAGVTTVTGGTNNTTNEAYMMARQILQSGGVGGLTVLGGNTASGADAYLTSGGNFILSASGDVNIYGSNGGGIGKAYIEPIAPATPGLSMTINGGSLNLKAGNATGADAYIQNYQISTIGVTGGNVSVAAGTGGGGAVSADARISTSTANTLIRANSITIDAENNTALSRAYINNNGGNLTFDATAGGLSVLGGTGAANNDAFISVGSGHAAISATGNVLVTANLGSAYITSQTMQFGSVGTPLGAGFTLTGGSDAAGTAPAYIQTTAGTIDLYTLSLVRLNAGSGGLGNHAYIHAQTNLQGTIGGLNMHGYSGAVANDAYIETGGTFTLNTLPGLNVNIRGGTNGSAYIRPTAGNPLFNLTAAGSIILQGGNGTGSRGAIENYQIGTISTGGTLRITGGTNPALNCPAYIRGNAVNAQIIGGDVLLQGNNSPNGTNSATIEALTGNLTVQATSTNVNLSGGTLNINNGAYIRANSGHLTVLAATDVTLNANLSVANITANTIQIGNAISPVGSLSLNGGSNGGGLSFSQIFSNVGDMNIYSSGNIQLISGSNNNANVALLASNGGLNIPRAANITLTSTDAYAAMIVSNDINIGTALLPVGAITLQAGNDPFGSAQAQIESTAGHIDIYGGALTMTGGTTFINNYARLHSALFTQVNLTGPVVLSASTTTPAEILTDNGDLYLETTSNIQLLGNARLIMNGVGVHNMTVIAGTNISTALIGAFAPFVANNSLTGQIALVVDNLFPTPPGIGPGAFVYPVGNINTGGGPLYIYTADRDFNTVTGALNGGGFVPGPEFVDSATERWNVYFPTAIGGVPYTFFYKEVRLAIATAKEVGFTDTAELFRLFHPFGEYIGRYIEVLINTKNEKEILEKRRYFIRFRDFEGRYPKFALTL